MRKLLGPIGFCMFMFCGYAVTVDSWDGAVFVFMGEQRSPAAVRSMRDYSAIDRKALFTSVHRQMIEGAKLIKQSGYMDLSLGHPLMKSANGKEFACRVQGRPGLFDRLELTFTGVGISAAGEQPQLIVAAECIGGSDLGRLQTISVPMKEILAGAPKDQEMQTYGDHPVMVHLKNIPGEWPTGWVLSTIRLYNNENPDETMIIDADKMRDTTTNGKLLSFEWMQ